MQGQPFRSSHFAIESSLQCQIHRILGASKSQHFLVSFVVLKTIDESNWKIANGIAEIQCETLADFLELFQEKLLPKGNFIFRGHAQGDWKLTSSLAREFGPSKNPNDWSDHYSGVFTEFLRELKGIGDHELRAEIDDYLSTSKPWIGHETNLDSYVSDICKTTPKIEYNQLWRLKWQEFRLLAIAQHYGMPTPLLDWSHSPFVAWYFALNSPDAKRPHICAMQRRFLEGKIGQFRLNRVRQWRCKLKSEIEKCDPNHELVFKPDLRRKEEIRLLELPKYKDELEEDLRTMSYYSVDPESHVNERLSRQQGVLTKHNLNVSIEDIVSSLDSFLKEKEPYIYKIFLSKQNSSEAMKILKAMNVTGTSLYPGIEGLAKASLESLRHNLVRDHRGHGSMRGFL